MGAHRDSLQINHPSAKEPRQVRLSRNIRRVIDATVFDGAKLVDALQTVGITRSAYNLASRKPEFAAYQQECVRVLRTSAAARSIGRVDNLADTAASEHVKLSANELLMGIEGISKVTKTENMHVHQHLIPGLTVMRSALPVAGDDALLIGDQRAQPRIAHEIKRIGTPVPHPEDRNVVIEPSSTSDSRGAKRAGRGVK